MSIKIKQQGPPSLIGTKATPFDEFLDVLRKFLNYCLCFITCGCYPGNKNLHGDAVYETELTEDEGAAVQNLLDYLDSCEFVHAVYINHVNCPL